MTNEHLIRLQKSLTCKQALQLLLDQVDFTNHACRPTDMVAACIPIQVLDKCHEAIRNEKDKP